MIIQFIQITLWIISYWFIYHTLIKQIKRLEKRIEHLDPHKTEREWLLQDYKDEIYD